MLTTEDKYLKHYAESEWRLAASWAACHSLPVNRLLLVPAYREGANLPRLLFSAARAAAYAKLKALVIIVVNHQEDAPEEVKADNRQTLDEWHGKLERCCYLSFPGTAAAFAGSWQGIELLFVDRASPGAAFPVGEGVGLARKIAGDIAYALWRCQACDCAFAATSDGDAVLPSDYFHCPEWRDAPGLGALLYPYRHEAPAQASVALMAAIAQYEAYLRYYVQGLGQAGSPYAYGTIGSTISFSLPLYAKVRGFPRRQAGEDFYFLNKLRKLAPIKNRVNGEPIVLAGRFSERVPFGTGQALTAIVKDLQEARAYRVYHPAVFIVLRIFLRAAENFCAHGQWELFVSQGKAELLGLDLWVDRAVPKRAFGLADLLVVLRLLDADTFLQTLSTRAKMSLQRVKHFHIWFDAFRTLKFIHLLQEHFFSPQPLPQAYVKGQDNYDYRLSREPETSTSF